MKRNAHPNPRTEQQKPYQTRHLTLMDNCVSRNSWKQTAWSFQSCHHELLVAIHILPHYGVWREEAGDSRTRPCLGTPPSIRPMTELSLLESSRKAVLHSAQRGSHAQEGYGVVLWQPKGSEELGLVWASAVCPQEDSVGRALLMSPVV